MERRICPAEKHPLLVACNIVTIILGLGLAIQAILTGTAYLGGAMNSSLLAGIGLVFLGTSTGKLTQNFRHWDYGLTSIQKIFASLSILVGALAGGWMILNILNALNR